MKSLIYDATNPVDTSDVAKGFSEDAVAALYCAIGCANEVKGKVFRNAEDDGWVVNARLGGVIDGYMQANGLDPQVYKQCIIFTIGYDSDGTDVHIYLPYPDEVEQCEAFLRDCIDPAERDYKSVEVCDLKTLPQLPMVVYTEFGDAAFDNNRWWHERYKNLYFNVNTISIG